MNYITSCPECNTQFLISQDHLKAHRGKVQCGHCNHIFNAKNRLSKITEEEEAGEQAFLNTAFEEIAIEPPAGPLIEPVSTPAAGSGVVTIEFVHTPEEDTGSVTQPFEIPPQIEDLTAEPRFAILKKKTPAWLYFLGILLGLFAALQGIYFLRNQISVDYPRLKPLLVSACLPLQCKIELPKQLELLLIDDSDMQEHETYQSVINFSSTLINNANFTQAYPNIELTLTNTQDEAVIRTILKPHQYLGTGVNLAEGIAAHEEIHITLPIHIQDITAAGYRVQLIY
jgi:predicted Zn finger-like uncharacterized protein